MSLATLGEAFLQPKDARQRAMTTSACASSFMVHSLWALKVAMAAREGKQEYAWAFGHRPLWARHGWRQLVRV
jgi:hypothetical protein